MQHRHSNVREAAYDYCLGRGVAYVNPAYKREPIHDETNTTEWAPTSILKVMLGIHGLFNTPGPPIQIST